MTPEALRELRACVFHLGDSANVGQWAQAIALIDAELAQQAEIAGARAGLAALNEEALRAQLAEVTRERDEARAQLKLLADGAPCVVMRFSDYQKLKAGQP